MVRKLKYKSYVIDKIARIGFVDVDTRARVEAMIEYNSITQVSSVVSTIPIPVPNMGLKLEVDPIMEMARGSYNIG